MKHIVLIRFIVVSSLFLALFTLSSTKVMASHLMGGEITWECLHSGSDQGKLIFQLKLYRFCAGSGLQNSAIIQNPLYGNWGGTSSITLTMVTTEDLSINCGDSLLAMNCYDSARNLFSIEEYVYRSSPVTIYGVPQTYPTGSEFGFSICCRPPSVINVNGLASPTYYIRSKMFRYINPITGVADTLGTSSTASCYDSSPKFAQRPSITICSNNLYHYSHNAFDPDIDSLDYDWGAPTRGPNNFTIWNSGYSSTSQLPTTAQHPNNIPATIDKVSGEIKFKIFSPAGLYSTVVRVFTYRGGQPIAETYRDVALSIINCSYTNNPPVIDFKDCGSCPSYPSPAKDTVYAGDTVDFIINSTDIGFLPGGFPQRNFLNPTGFQFGNRFGDPNSGCPYPPCATLDTTNTFYSTVQNNWSGLLGISTRFKWVADCNHLPYVNNHFVKSSSHTFVFNVNDNYCPVPAIDSRTFTITILAPPPIPPPRFLCTDIIGDSVVRISWKIAVTSADDTLNSFRYYVLYRSISPNGPYTVLDSIDNINISAYNDSGLDLENNDYYYFIKGLSSCHSQSQQIESDTIAAINLKGEVVNSGSTVNLNWAAFGINNEFPASSVPEYLVWEIRGKDTTLLSRQLNTTISRSYISCFPDTIKYFIEVYDTTLYWGCTSSSNLLELYVGDSDSPPIQLLDSVSIRDDGYAVLGWSPISYPDLNTYYIMDCDTLVLDQVTQSTTIYIDSGNGVLNNSKPYSLASDDTCGNNNSIDKIMDCHSTMYLRSYFDKCDKLIDLQWNPYTYFRSGVKVEYRIFISENGGSFVKLINTDQTHFTYSDIIDSNEYCFYVQAWENEGVGPFSSSSNKSCEAVEILDVPEFSYLDYVSVVNNESIELCFRTEVNEDLQSFVVNRFSSIDSSREIIHTQYMTTPLDLNDSIMCFADTSVDVSGVWYTYYIDVIDDCNEMTSTSNSGNSILLKVKWDNNDIEHRLRWNEYEEWPNGVREYVIYQGLTSGNLKEIERISLDNLSGVEKRGNLYYYKHRLGMNDKDQEFYCYAIEAIEKEPYFRKNYPGQSKSNIVCIGNRPMLFIPNTFTPNSDDVNEVFRPHGSVEGLYKFSMLIFNRWGDLIFESFNPTIGWDGYFNGSESPSGTYVYRIEYFLNEDDVVGKEVQGKFNLLR